MSKMADTWNWQNQPEGDALTTKEDEGEKYFNIGHAKYVGGQVVEICTWRTSRPRLQAPVLPRAGHDGGI